MAGDDRERTSRRPGFNFARSVIRSRHQEARRCPKQGSEGAPDVWLDMHLSGHRGTARHSSGDELIVIT